MKGLLAKEEVMTKIPTKTNKTIRVKAPLKKVFDYMSDVTESSKCQPGVEKVEEIDDRTYRWTQKEKDYGPVKFQVTYTLHYDTNDKDRITWKSTGEGNTDVEGGVWLKAIDDKTTEVKVENALASDVPIPRLMKAVAKPIANKELEKTVNAYLENLKKAIEG